MQLAVRPGGAWDAPHIAAPANCGVAPGRKRTARCCLRPHRRGTARCLAGKGGPPQSTPSPFCRPPLLNLAARPPRTHPAADVMLSFSFPVVLSSLQSALKLASCCNRSDASGRSVRVLPCGPPYVSNNPFAPRVADPMSANSTCAVVQVIPGLGAGQVVALQLPAGASYNPIAGRALKTTKSFLWGLRRFRVPLRDDFTQLQFLDDDFYVRGCVGVWEGVDWGGWTHSEQQPTGTGEECGGGVCVKGHLQGRWQ